jgi:hypothetical protein
MTDPLLTLRNFARSGLPVTLSYSSGTYEATLGFPGVRLVRSDFDELIALTIRVGRKMLDERHEKLRAEALDYEDAKAAGHVREEKSNA